MLKALILGQASSMFRKNQKYPKWVTFASPTEGIQQELKKRIKLQFSSTHPGLFRNLGTDVPLEWAFIFSCSEGQGRSPAQTPLTYFGYCCLYFVHLWICSIAQCSRCQMKVVYNRTSSVVVTSWKIFNTGASYWPTGTLWIIRLYICVFWWLPLR